MGGSGTMTIDKRNTFAQLAIRGIDGANSFGIEKTIPISEYMLKQVGIDFSTMTDDRKNLLTKNFIHLMCSVMSDINAANDRLKK